MQGIVKPPYWAFRRLHELGRWDIGTAGKLEAFEKLMVVMEESESQLQLFSGEVNPDHPVATYKEEDLKSLIESCCNHVAYIESYGRISTIDYSDASRDLGVLPIEKKWLEKALKNVLDNACKYSFMDRGMGGDDAQE